MPFLVGVAVVFNKQSCRITDRFFHALEPDIISGEKRAQILPSGKTIVKDHKQLYLVFF
jgi:hypothetical protein